MSLSSSNEAERNALPVLAAACLAALVLPLSFSGGAVATPAIGRDLGGSATSLTWITNAFILTFGSLLMAAGDRAHASAVLHVLIVITLLSAVATFAFQGRTPDPGENGVYEPSDERRLNEAANA